MEARNFLLLMDFILLIAVISLFIFIRWHFSRASSHVKNRLQIHEVALSIFLGLIVLTVIGDNGVSLLNRAVFLVLSVGIYYGICYLILMNLKRKPLLYPRSYLIFHNGKFLKGAILQNKLSEDDILKTLKLKGVSDLKEVDTIILEADGELSVIYKKKVNVPT